MPAKAAAKDCLAQTLGYDRRGAVAVEFALTVGLLFLVLFTSIEFMRVNTIVNSTENIAYEAAREAIVPGSTSVDAENTAREMLEAIGIQGADIVVQPDPVAEDTPEITVTINVPLDRNCAVTPRFFVGDTLTKSCTLSREINATIEQNSLQPYGVENGDPAAADPELQGL